jgi:hypothetical protein
MLVRASATSCILNKHMQSFWTEKTSLKSSEYVYPQVLELDDPCQGGKFRRSNYEFSVEVREKDLGVLRHMYPVQGKLVSEEPIS